MLKVAIIGASGVIGGELLRILLQHPSVEVVSAASRNSKGKLVSMLHPNLRGFTTLTFTDDPVEEIASRVDVVFLAVPHGTAHKIVPSILETGNMIIDMSADFRLKDSTKYQEWYGWDHSAPDLLNKFVYGNPELHREEIRVARLIANPGCIASTSIYSLAPLAKAGLINSTVHIDAKTGSSASGSDSSESTSYSVKTNSIRTYKPSGHRHTPEVEQELSLISRKRTKVALTAQSVPLVRGILTTSSTYYSREIDEKVLWNHYRNFYRDERFVRFMMNKNGIFRYPDPKLVVGSNFVDLGFDIDRYSGRIISMGAIDNLFKGAAGNAIASMNLMNGFPEEMGLTTIPLYPV